MLTPSDIAVLIPAHGRCEMTRKAVQCALAAGAGEVIVSEDASGADMSAVAGIEDVRFRYVLQPVNLGLWRNHLALLRLTERRWIKFLQTDDAFAADCLATMCSVIGPETTLVSVLPIYRDLDTGEERSPHKLQEPLRIGAGAYVDRMARRGNEPGRPSYCLYRRDALVETEEAWGNDMSCDLVANATAAARGEVVLLPPGPMFCGIHSARDGATQSFDLFARRLVNSMQFLAGNSDARVKRFASVYGLVEALWLGRVFLGRKRRGHDARWGELRRHFLGTLRSVRIRDVVSRPHWILDYMRHKLRS